MLVAKARLTEIRLPPLKIITSKAFSLTSKYLLIANASRRVLYSVVILISMLLHCPTESRRLSPTEAFP